MMAEAKGKGAGPGRGARRPPAEAGGGSRPGSAATGEEAHLPWGRRNYLILAAGGGAILIGFLLLIAGDTVFAPILLVGGFLGLIPWGIITRPKSVPAGQASPPARKAD